MIVDRWIDGQWLELHEDGGRFNLRGDRVEEWDNNEILDALGGRVAYWKAKTKEEEQ